MAFILLRMKNLFIILCIASTLTINAQEKAQPKPQNVVYADVDYILSMLPEAKELEEELKATQTRLQNDFEAKQNRFKTLFTEYQTKGASMSDTVRQRTESELMALNQELQDFPQDAQKTLENTRSLRMAPVYLMVGKALDAVAVANGFSVIIPKTLSGYDVILFADERKNVSNLVLQQLGVQVENKK